MSVELRKKRIGDGKVGLYLDIYNRGHGYTESLDLRLTKLYKVGATAVKQLLESGKLPIVAEPLDTYQPKEMD